MLANVLIILFLIAMVGWGALRVGLFRGLIYFIVTVAAASLAVATWEHTVRGILIDPLPRYAWCLGLISPFVAWLVLLRLLTLYFVPDPLPVTRSADVVGGGVLGLLTGVAVSGMFMIAIGFLPTQVGWRWYSPRIAEQDGSIEPNPQGRLWVPVDRIVEHALSALSDGVFNAYHTMSKYQPDLATQAALFRHSCQRQESVLVAPWSTKVTAVYSWPMPIEGLDTAFHSQLGPNALQPGMQLVAVVTLWESTDTVRSQRPQQTQTRLAGIMSKDRRIVAHLHPPTGWAQHDPATGQQRFNSFADPPDLLPVLNRHEPLTWVFVIPIAEQAAFLLERNLRLGLSGRQADADALIAALGLPVKKHAPPQPDPASP